MNELKKLKEKQINDFIYQVELSDVSATEIKNGLKNLLGEEPAVKFNYKSEKKMNETTGKAERTPQELDSIEVYYSYIGDDNNLHAEHMKYIVN